MNHTNTNELSSEVELERYRFRVETIERFFPPVDPRRFCSGPVTSIESIVYYVNGSVTETYRTREEIEGFCGDYNEKHRRLVREVEINPERYLI